jgi:uncharacterized protein (TIGR02271 family)
MGLAAERRSAALEFVQPVACPRRASSLQDAVDLRRRRTFTPLLICVAAGIVHRRETSVAEQERRVIPVAEEEAVVGRRRSSDKIRVRKLVRREERTIEQPVTREEVRIKRVAVKRFVDHPPEIRHEGDLTIVPLVEEVPVVVMRLFVREEIHITKRRVTERRRMRVTLRREEPEITRNPGGTR